MTVVSPPPLRSAPIATAAKEREHSLFLEYQSTGDMAAREELVERFLPLARRLARKYERMNEPFEDLLQVASVGLVKAIDRYEPGQGTAFASYAVPTILGEIKRYFRDSGWAVHVPRGVQERVLRVNQAIEKLSPELGRSPTPAEVSAELGDDLEDVLEAMEAGGAYNTISLEAPLGTEDPDSGTYADSVGDLDDRYDRVEMSDTLSRAMKAVPERERMILFLRFNEGLTQSEIAERLGISQMHVSRLIRRTLDRLRVVASARAA
ncbi:MAG TPA: SigB/SigF/SigG family RNA polymerase sigma factor [Thermoleophilaceae bacterium]